jgi:hypothetical protein
LTVRRSSTEETSDREPPSVPEKFHDEGAAKSEQYEVRGQSPFDAFIFDFRVLQIDTFAGNRNADWGIYRKRGRFSDPDQPL